jgi:uncharacterized membrane protein (UPF0127 family)
MEIWKFIILISIVIISGCIEEQKMKIFTNSSQIEIKVEIADTFEERQRGLMFRDKLENNSGMLFVFEKEQYVTFWMKNMRIPLDMIFISENGTINEIKEDLKPCEKEPCLLYPSNFPVKYVLEVNSGFCRQNNIKVGDKVKI